MECPHVKPRYGWVRCPVCGAKIVDVEEVSLYTMPDNAIIVIENKGKVPIDESFLDGAKIFPSPLFPGEKGVVLTREGKNLSLFGKELPKPPEKNGDVKVEIPPLVEMKALPSTEVLSVAETDALPVKVRVPDELAQFVRVFESGQELNKLREEETLFVVTDFTADTELYITIGEWKTSIKIKRQKKIVRVTNNLIFRIPKDASNYIGGPIKFYIEIVPEDAESLEGETVKVMSPYPEWLTVEPVEFELAKEVRLTMKIDTTKAGDPKKSSIWIGFEACGVKQTVPIKIEWLERNQPGILAVDFGASYTCVFLYLKQTMETIAVFLPGLSETFGSREGEIPSVVEFVNLNKRIYEISPYVASEYPQNYTKIAKNFKSMLADNKELTYWDATGNHKRFTAVEVTGIFLKKIIGEVLGRFPLTPQNTQIGYSYPVGFTKQLRENLRTVWNKVAYSFSFNPEEVKPVLPEPVALFVAYYGKIRESIPDAGLFGVFDFGGYTADFSLIGVDENKNIVVIHSSEILYNGLHMGGELLNFELGKKLIEMATNYNIPYPQKYTDLIDSNQNEYHNYAELISIAEDYKRFGKLGSVFRELKDANGNKIEVHWDINQKASKELNKVMIGFVDTACKQIESRTKYIAKVLSNSEDFAETYPSLWEKICDIADEKGRLDAFILGGNSMRNKTIRQNFQKNNSLSNKFFYEEEIVKKGVSRGLLTVMRLGGQNRTIDLSFAPVSIGTFDYLGGFTPIIRMGEYVKTEKVIENIWLPKPSIYVSLDESSTIYSPFVTSRNFGNAANRNFSNARGCTVTIKISSITNEDNGVKNLVLEIFDSQTNELLYREAL